ncbi:MAG: hypothetical protein E4H08_01100 [Candidatus Atribacteria bacterium]|nr:MAG: hypothetical protein E4H08_01100 [Candidatus Atribacteria bacterium]
MQTIRCWVWAYFTILVVAMVPPLAVSGAATDWRDVVSPELASLISPNLEGERTIIVELERSTAPDLDELMESYSYVARTVWSSEALKAYCEQLSTWCELEPGWNLNRSGHAIWETTTAYIAFAHALVARCAIQNIPQVAMLPFVVGIRDGEAHVTILRSDSEGDRSGAEAEESLLVWTENVVEEAELGSKIRTRGWLPVSQTLLDHLIKEPFAVEAISNDLTTLPEDDVQLVGLSVDILMPPEEEEYVAEAPWPYGLPVHSLKSIAQIVRADLLQCADAAFHTRAEYVTLATTDSVSIVALLWESAALSGVAAVGAVEGAGVSLGLPLAALPVPEAIATMGSYADRVVVEWQDLAGASSYEVLRAAAGAQAFDSIGIAEGTTFSDWDVETCLQYRYSIRVNSESGVGLESQISRGFVGEVPEIVEWIRAGDGTTSAGGVKIEWAPAENATVYNLWRSEPVKTAYQSAAKVYLLYRGSETSFLDLDVVPGIEYNYCAVPYNGCGASAVGNPSDRGTAMFIMPPEGRPKPPEWITASLVEPANQVNLSWRAVSGVGEYHVYRADSYEGPYEVICTTANSTWSDTSAEHCQDYWYRIQSVSGGEAGPLSAVVHGVCGGKPGPPSGVIASDSTYADAIRLDWASGHEADCYWVFRATSPDGPYTRIAVAEELHFIDVGLEPGKTFWYRVAARNLCGGSGYSDPVWGATTY